MTMHIKPLGFIEKQINFITLFPITFFQPPQGHTHIFMAEILSDASALAAAALKAPSSYSIEPVDKSCTIYKWHNWRETGEEES